MVKFLDASEEEIFVWNLPLEELDVLLKAHEIITRNRMKIKLGRGPIVTGS